MADDRWTHTSRYKIVEIKMLRYVYGETRRSVIGGNENIGNSVREASVAGTIKELRSRWISHMKKRYVDVSEQVWGEE